MIVLVTGGRDYHDWYTIQRTLSLIGISRLIHGAAAGTDAHANGWAERMGVPKTGYPIKRPGEDGFQRNQRMLDAEPDIGLVVAFPGNGGTADMVKRARRKGLTVIEVKEITWPGNTQLKMHWVNG